MKRTIKSLEKQYNIDVQAIIDAYSEGLSIRQMVEKGLASTSIIRTVLAVLNLRLKRKYRSNDVTILKERINSDVEDYNKTLIDELTTDISVLQKELYKNSKTIQTLRDSNTALRKTIREYNREEAFNSLLQSLIEEYVNNIPSSNISLTNVEPNEDGTNILVLSDIHFGEVIPKNVTNGINEFNNQICKERILQVVQALLTSSFKTDRLRVYLLGDILNGVIHNGDLKGELPPLETVIEFADFIIEVFNSLTKVYDNIVIKMVNGNHSRLNDNQKTYHKAYDLEYILYNLIKSRLEGCTIEYSTNSYLVDEVEGHQIGLLHGDTFRGYKGYNDASLYKVKNVIDNIYGTNIQSIISGHTHNPVICSNPFNGLNIVNGCLSGINEYGLTSGFDSIYPSQTIGRIEEGEWKEIQQVKVY